LKRVQHKDGLAKARDIDDAKSAARVSHPDFPNAGADRRHRLPIVRFEPALHPVELETGIAPGALGKFTQAVERVAEKDYRFNQ